MIPREAACGIASGTLVLSARAPSDRLTPQMNKRCPVIDRPPISSPLTLGVTLTSKGKAMGIASHKLGAVAVALGTTAALVLPALQVSASAQEIAIQPRVSGYSWYWSDGAGGTRRTFSQSQYGTASRLPKLVVEGDCTAGARVGDRIKLQWRDSMGRYRTEDTAYVSNCVGRYKLAFYPYDSSGSWARGTYKYRLIIPGGGGYKYFEITYTKR